MESRKIIQISTSGGWSPDSGNWFVLTALCNDGTVWEKSNGQEWKCIDTDTIQSQ